MTKIESREEAAYTAAYYERRRDSARQSAQSYLGVIHKWLPLTSVADIGCGDGSWLFAAHELGVKELVGLDGIWNTALNSEQGSFRFIACDLHDPPPLEKVFDLAISMEVAEHLSSSAGPGLVQYLTGISEVVLFSAALPGQGGRDHINERFPSYWARLFNGQGFLAYDVFRARFWDNEYIEPWYRQNAALYVRAGSRAEEGLSGHGLVPIDDVSFLDCIHPQIFELALQNRTGLSYHLKDILPSAIRAIKRRV